jgi:hypothetical protein
MPSLRPKRELVLRVSIDLDTGAVRWTRETPTPGQAGPVPPDSGAPPGPLSTSLGQAMADAAGKMVDKDAAAAALAGIGFNRPEVVLDRFPPWRIMEVIRALPPPGAVHTTPAAWVNRALFRNYTIPETRDNGRP